MESTTANINKRSSKFKPDGAPWFQNKNFERYWNVYNRCMIYAHKDVLSRCYETENNLAAQLYNMVQAPWPESFSDFRGTKISSKNARKKRKRRNKKIANAAKEAASKQSMFVLTDDDTLQVQLEEKMKIDDPSDVDDDYITFMKTNVIHRIKWNHIKEQKKQQSEDELQQGLEFDPEEHPDVVREKEMHDLYGASAAQIHGMETAIQLSFDRISTLHQPTLWPNIPLRLSY